jgi:hypothetical protein
MIEQWHILPRNDLREHTESKDCWCEPIVTGDIITHNALDEREKYETGERKPH